MNEIFKLFLSLSVSGSILACILFLLKPVLKNKLSKTWHYYIWLIVIARMLMPYSFHIGIVGTLFNHVENRMSAQPEMNDYGEVSTKLATDNEFAWQPPQAATSVIIQEVKKTGYWSEVRNSIWLFWMVIALLLFARKVTSYFNFVRFIKAGTHEATDLGVLEVYNNAHLALGIKKPLALYTNKLASAPMLVGIIKPFIVLPSIQLTTHELYNVFIHELTHYKRMDIFYKWLTQATVCIHWFNPLVYIISCEINKNCELSCDEMIIKKLNADGKKQYGNTLIASLSSNGNYGDTIVSITLNEDAKLLKERLGAILNFRKKSKLTIILSMFLTALLFCGATFTGAYGVTVSVQLNTQTNIASSKENQATVSAPLNTQIDIASSKENQISIAINNSNYDEIAETAYRDRKINFFATIIHNVSEEKKLQLMDRAYNDNQINFFTLLQNPLNGLNYDEMAERIYKDRKINFFTIIIPNVSEEKKLQLMDRAYNDDQINFFSVLQNGSVTISSNEDGNNIFKYAAPKSDYLFNEEIGYFGYARQWISNPLFSLKTDTTVNLEMGWMVSSGSLDFYIKSKKDGKIVYFMTGSNIQKNESIDLMAGEYEAVIEGTEVRGVSYSIKGYGNKNFSSDMASGNNKTYIASEADKRGIEIMQYSGTWGKSMEEVLPYMSNEAIDKAVEIYNQKHPYDKQKVASDYYNADDNDIIKGKVAINLTNKNTYNISESGSFKAENNETLTLHIFSNLNAGNVDLFLFDPNGKEQRISIDDSSVPIKSIKLTKGTWQYNCSGTFKYGGNIKIIGVIEKN